MTIQTRFLLSLTLLMFSAGIYHHNSVMFVTGIIANIAFVIFGEDDSK